MLGSTQPEADVDLDAAVAAGVAVARRRSGGGAVWVDPEDPLWIDVWVPRRHRLHDDDVGRAAHPVGAAFAAALTSLGADPALSVHRDAFVCPPGARQVCFVGSGPGEVRTATGKVVGISQRRSRGGARFQCALYRRWDPNPLASCLRTPPPPAVLAAAGIGLGELGVDADIATVDVVDALIVALDEVESARS